jgi:hypothetical protein
MEHELDVRIRLLIDETEIEPGEQPIDAAERIVCNRLDVDIEAVDVAELVR